MPTVLISVYDKTDVVPFAQSLRELGWDILASGGTAQALTAGGIAVRDVADIVGGGPMLGHRVVTLSREIHAGLLAREHERAELERLDIPWIDMVVVDLYPLKETIDMPGVIEEMVIEATDIGGPALLRSAAKGNRIAICHRHDWAAVVYWLRDLNGERLSGRYDVVSIWAAKAEVAVAQYALTSAHYRSHGTYEGVIGGTWKDCSGENPWQSHAGAFQVSKNDPLAVHRFEVIEGIRPSYTNWRDIDRLLHTMTHIAAVEKTNIGHVSNIAIGVKHGNACGAAMSGWHVQAMEDMLYGDTRAIFGGMVMTNFPITEEVADVMTRQDGTDKKRIFDGIVAPGFTKEAIEILRRENGRCRLYKNEALYGVCDESINQEPLMVPVRGGFLRQDNYTYVLREEDIAYANMNGSAILRSDAYLAWAVGSTSNSNTVTLVRDGMLIGNGVGQQDRVSACELALKRADDAGHSIEGAVAYSDGFFPFNDGPEILIEAGVSAILAPRGSVNDDRLKALCQEKNVLLMLIPHRGFFGH